MQSKRFNALAVAAVTAALMGSSAHAVGLDLNYDWDGELPLDGAGPGESGIWHANSDEENEDLKNWTADNGATYQYWDNSGDNAIFGANGGTVTVLPNVTLVNSLRFNHNYTLNGSGFNLTSGIINVANNRSATLNIPIDSGAAGLSIGDTNGFAGTLTLGAPISHTGTTILRRSTIKLGVDNALPTTQLVNMPEGSAVATLDLNGFNQTIQQWSGAGQNFITNASATTSTLTMTTAFPGGFTPHLDGNMNVTLNGGNWTPNQNNEFTGTLWIKPTAGAAAVTVGQSARIGSASGLIKLDATDFTAQLVLHPALDTSSVRSRVYTRDIELIHGTGNAELRVSGAYDAILTGSISGGTEGGNGIRQTSGQGAIVLAGNNSYVGTTTLTGQSASLYLAHDNALGATSAVNLSGGKNTLGFIGGVTIDLPAIQVDLATNNPADSGFGTLHAFSGDNVLTSTVRTTASSSWASWIGADAGASLTLTGAIIGPGRKGMTKMGYGTVVLAGPATYGANGGNALNATAVNEGTLRLDFSQATKLDGENPVVIDENIINHGMTDMGQNTTSSLTLAGGTLEVKGRAEATNVQSFSNRSSAPNFTVSAGASAVRVVQNDAASVTVNLGRLMSSQRAVGSTVDFTLPEVDGETSLRKGAIVLPTGGVGDNGTILTANGSAFATVGASEWAALDAGGARNIVPGSEISGFYTPNTADSLSGNVDMSGGVDTMLPADASVSSLRFNDGAARTINVGAGQTLSTGGILVTPAAGANVQTITAGTLTSGITALTSPSQDVVVIQNNPAAPLRIESVIADTSDVSSGHSVTGLTKSGPGTLLLTSANTYTGETHLNEGMIKLEGSGALGSGRLLFHGGVLGLPGGSTFTRAVGSSGTVQWLGSGGFAAYGGDVTVNLGGATAAVTFGSNPGTAGSFVMTGSALILGAPDADGTVIFQNPISFRSPQQVQQREIRVLDGAAAVDARFTGALGSDGGLLKTGDGTMEVMAASTYTGPTTVEAGTIQLGVNTGLPNTPLTIKAGTVDLKTFNISQTRSLTLGGGATGTTAVITGTTGIFTLGADLVYDGNLADDNGATIAGTMSVSTGTRTFTVNDSANAAVDLTVSANITSTTGGITKSGPGVMLLSGNNANTGTTRVNEGVLRLAGGNAIANNAAVVMADAAGAVLDLANSSETIGSLAGGGSNGGNVALGSGTLTTGDANTNTAYAGVISGAGALVKSGTGTFTLTGANTYAGGTTVNAGLIAVSSNDNLGAAGSGVTLNGGGIRFNASTSLGTRSVSLGGGGGTFDSNGNDATVGGAVSGSGALTKTGAGTVSLTSAASNYSGGTTLNAGTVQFAGTLGTGNTNFNGGGIKFAAGNTSDLTAGGRVVTLNSTAGQNGDGVFVPTSNTIDTNGNNVTFANGIGNNGPGHLIKAGAGTLTINGSNTHFGATVSTGGTLVLGASSFASSAVRAAGGDVVLAASPAGDRLIYITGSYPNDMSVSGGGKIDLKNNKAIVAASTTGSTTIGNWNAITQSYTGYYGRVAAGRNGGAWNGSGIMTSMPDALAGITGIAVAPANEGDSFAGQDDLAQGDVKMMYTYVGDADLDGDVDGDDYFRIDTSFTAGGIPAGFVGYANGDFDYNGRIDADDYFYIDRSYARQSTSPLYASLPVGGAAVDGVTAVPEPSSLAIFALAAVGAMRRRRQCK